VSEVKLGTPRSPNFLADRPHSNTTGARFWLRDALLLSAQDLQLVLQVFQRCLSGRVSLFNPRCQGWSHLISFDCTIKPQINRTFPWGGCSRENVTSLSAIIQWFPEGFHLNPTNDRWSWEGNPMAPLCPGVTGVTNFSCICTYEILRWS